jgi:hypothetical protein
VWRDFRCWSIENWGGEGEDLCKVVVVASKSVTWLMGIFWGKQPLLLLDTRANGSKQLRHLYIARARYLDGLLISTPRDAHSGTDTSRKPHVEINRFAIMTKEWAARKCLFEAGRRTGGHMHFPQTFLTASSRVLNYSELFAAATSTALSGNSGLTPCSLIVVFTLCRSP